MVASLVGTALLVTSLSGCGDSSDDSLSGTESWADGVCSSVKAWTDAVGAARDTLSDTSNLSADSFRAAVSDVSQATETFVSDLEGVGSPDTEAGGEAEQELQDLSSSLAEQGQVIRDATSEKPAGLDAMLDQVSIVTGALSTMVSDAQTTVADIQGLDGAQELEDAFTSTPSCQELTAGRGSSS